MWTKEEYDAYVARTSERRCAVKPGRVDHDSNEAQGAKLERDNRDALAIQTQAKARRPGKFIVRVVAFRCRLLDEDNLAEKFHVDALRYASILPCDSPGKASISVTQTKVENPDLERTEITIGPL